MALAISCLLSGCRTARDNQIELLERELRTQEDYIYELEDYVVQYSERLRSMRCAQAVHIETEPTVQKSVVKRGESKRAESKRSAEQMPEPQPPALQPREEEPFDLDGFEPPPLEIEDQQGSTSIGTTDGLALLDETPAPQLTMVAEPEADRTGAQSAGLRPAGRSVLGRRL